MFTPGETTAALDAAVGRSLREAAARTRTTKVMGVTTVMSHQPIDPFAVPAAQTDDFRTPVEISPLPLAVCD